MNVIFKERRARERERERERERDGQREKCDKRKTNKLLSSLCVLSNGMDNIFPYLEFLKESAIQAKFKRQRSTGKYKRKVRKPRNQRQNYNTVRAVSRQRPRDASLFQHSFTDDDICVKAGIVQENVRRFNVSQTRMMAFPSAGVKAAISLLDAHADVWL